MLFALFAGLVVGVPASLAPGPLLAVVVTQTLRHGAREGALVAAAPLATDLPIIVAAWLLLGGLADGAAPLLGALSLCGGGYLLWLAAETWRSGPPSVAPATARPRSLRRGLLVNLLNPHPYLFWGTVGVPYMLRLGGLGAPPAWAFALAFFAALVGGKVVVALLVGRSRGRLGGPAYRALMRGLAVGLALFGGLLLRDGARLLGAA